MNSMVGADLTGRHGKASPGLVITLSFVACGHKGMRAGASMRGTIPWRCAKCTAAKKQAAKKQTKT